MPALLYGGGACSFAVCIGSFLMLSNETVKIWGNAAAERHLPFTEHVHMTCVHKAAESCPLVVTCKKCLLKLCIICVLSFSSWQVWVKCPNE